MVQRTILDRYLKEAKQLIREIEKENIHIDRAILFGSQVLGTANEWSDVDLALVSRDFNGIRFLDNQRILKAILRVNENFETHPYTPEDFADSPFVRDEILEHGIEIKGAQ